MKIKQSESNPLIDSKAKECAWFGDIGVSQFSDNSLWIENGDEAGAFNEADFIKHIQSFFDGRF